MNRARIASHETVEKRIAGLSAARRIRETAPAYPHFLDNEQIARRSDPHLTAWFPAIDRLDRLITRHVAPSIETEVIDESIEGAHFRSANKNIFPSFLQCNSIDVNDVRSKGKHTVKRFWRIDQSETYLCPVQRVWKIPSRRDEQISTFGNLPCSLKQKIIQ